jgi:hypothetical protein
MGEMSWGGAFLWFLSVNVEHFALLVKKMLGHCHAAWCP